MEGGQAAASGTPHWEPANLLFLEACNLSLAPCLRKDRLQKAIALYHQALRNAASRVRDIAIINKNLGSAHWRSAQLVQEDVAKDVLNFHLKQGCKHYLSAIFLGRDSQPHHWLAGVQALLSDHVKAAMASFKEWDQATRWSCLRKLSTALSEASGSCEAAAMCKGELAKQLFWEGVTLLEPNGMDRMQAATKCASLMNESYQLLVEAAQRGTAEQLGEIDVQMKEVILYQCSCDSIRATYQGDAILTSLLTHQEHLDMDLVWLAIDKFKEAAVLAREQDTEAEGTALSRLGHVYKKVLKMEGTAHHYYFKAVELALTFPPGRVNKMVWAKEAIAAVGEHQEKVKREEAAKEEQEKEPYLEMMRDELAALQGVMSSSAENLLKHVYTKHPPKNPSHTMGLLSPCDPGLTKKALLRAISHYHTDKNRVAEHGMKWHVLCGEIVRLLNLKYVNYK